MELGEAQKGFSSKSELFDSLRRYLDNKNRLQPIIGLGSIVECVKADTCKGEALYICEVCICRLSKADMRNHIMGSLHRYNYIKAWYPHLISGWQENSELSKLAWPLMDIAKLLEGKEGPGDVQLLEVEDDVYQKIATYSENDAITLISSLRAGQGDGEPESHPEATPSQSQRIVLLAQNPWRQPEKSPKADISSHKTPHQMSSEPSMLYRNGSCFFDSYTGTKPLIGLIHVVECRSEDGRTFCFLCHCCRTRVNKRGVIDHLTSSSHLTNYLMEIHPEQVYFMKAADNANHEFLRSLAKKVEEEEGRGEPKEGLNCTIGHFSNTLCSQVVNAPESLCILMTSKSYKWCVRRLCNGSRGTNSRQMNVAVKGPSFSTTSVQGMPNEHPVAPSRWTQKMTTRTKTRRKKKKATNTVFNVSLPLTEGAVLLERTSFSKDNLPLLGACSPSADRALVPSPESQTEDSKLEGYTKLFARNYNDHTLLCRSSQLQHDIYSEDGGASQYMGPEGNITRTLYQGMNEYFSDKECVTEARDQKVFAERNYNRQHGFQERSNTNSIGDWKNKCLETQNEGLSSAVPHMAEQTSYDSSYAYTEGCAAQWYNAVAQSKIGTGVEVSSEKGHKDLSSVATWHHYQQPHQYMAQAHASLVPHSVGHHGSSGELVPHFNAATIGMYPYAGDCYAHNTAPEPRKEFHEIKPGQLQTYVELTIGHVPTAPQYYMTEPMVYQAVQDGYGVIGDPNYIVRPLTNYNHNFPHPEHDCSGVRGMFHSNVKIPPRQAPCDPGPSDVNSRVTDLSGRFSGSEHTRVQLMHCNSQF